MGHFVPGLILGALAPVLEERAMAEGAAALWSTNVHGLTREGAPFTLLSFLTGGTGARRESDGLSTTAFPSGVSGIPVEVFENRCPLVMVERQLETDSGGPGKFRGGLGYRTVYAGTRLAAAYRLSPFTDRIRQAAPGLAGGRPGKPGFFGRADGEPLDGKRTLVADPKELIVLQTPGGGGYGRPFERDLDLVRADVRAGLVSRQKAAEAYGVWVEPDGTVNLDETARLRGTGATEGSS
jgi:N-methylhydantoinase B